MPTQADIARHLIVSPQRVTALVQEGMPIDSYRSVDRWRKNHPRKRAPTNGNCKVAVEETEPLEVIEGKEGKPRGRPMKPKKPSNTGDSLLDALNNAITVSNRAFEVFEKAVCGHKIGAMSTLLSVHNKAAEARVKLEKAYREEQERRGILVDKTIMLEICRRTIEPMVRRMKKLPTETGPECIGDDPLKSVKILDLAVAKIVAVGHKAMTDAFADGFK